MNILLTGSNGFVGRWMYQALEAKGHTIIPFTGNLTDEKTFPSMEFDLLVHCAAVVDKAKWSSDALWAVNVGGTQKLMQRYPECRMILLSSTDIEKKELSPYGKSKRAAEEAVLKISKHLAIRAPSVFGPRDTHYKLIPRLFKYFLGYGEPVVVNDGQVEHAYVSWLVNQVCSSLHVSGLTRVKGCVVPNTRLSAMIKSICLGHPWSSASANDQRMISALRKCEPYYRELKNGSVS